MQPLISVIVPVYNIEKYIGRCIESIVNQTYKNLEILLVDDGSPDHSGRICDDYAEKDARIKVIHKQRGRESMTVVYNCDENYVGTFATSVLSLFESNQRADEINVYLIENGISSKSRERLEEIATAYHRHIFFSRKPEVDGLSPSVSSARLFMAEILPPDTEKAIYIDCDTIITDSLELLWNLNISGYEAAMVKDVMGMNDRKLLGISPDGIYWTDALMLVNVKRWREEKMLDKFIDYIKKMQGIVPFYEMGILTAVLDGKVKELPARYCVQTPYYSFTADELTKIKKLKSFYSNEDIEEAKNHPVMIHFTTDFLIPLRPWMSNCNHPCTSQYLSFRAKTPWENDPLQNKRIPTAKKLYSAFFRHIPRRFGLWTTKQLYVHIKPFMYRIQRRKQIRQMAK